MHDDKLNGIPLRFYFTYLRTCIVSGSERPCSWPFCHYVSWERINSNQMRVWYVRLDLPGDGHKPRLRHRRSRPEEMIVCAKRLTALPPRRWQYRPTRAQRKAVQPLLRAWLEKWHCWAAEYEPVPTWRDKWARWWGPSKCARQIILASEVRADKHNQICWLDFFQSHRYSYLKMLWHYPQVPNVIRARELAEHKLEIVGYIPIEPSRQWECQRWCQRILVLDHGAGERKQVFGIDRLDNYRDCVITSTLYPGCEPEPMTEGRLNIIDADNQAQCLGHKFHFLQSLKGQQ